MCGQVFSTPESAWLHGQAQTEVVFHALQESPRSSNKWSKQSLGMTEEEAIAAQQRMFAEARAQMTSGQIEAPQ